MNENKKVEKSVWKVMKVCKQVDKKYANKVKHNNGAKCYNYYFFLPHLFLCVKAFLRGCQKR